MSETPRPSHSSGADAAACLVVQPDGRHLEWKSAAVLLYLSIGLFGEHHCGEDNPKVSNGHFDDIYKLERGARYCRMCI